MGWLVGEQRAEQFLCKCKDWGNSCVAGFRGTCLTPCQCKWIFTFQEFHDWFPISFDGMNHWWRRMTVHTQSWSSKSCSRCLAVKYNCKWWFFPQMQWWLFPLLVICASLFSLSSFDSFPPSPFSFWILIQNTTIEPQYVWLDKLINLLYTLLNMNCDIRIWSLGFGTVNSRSRIWKQRTLRHSFFVDKDFRNDFLREFFVTIKSCELYLFILIILTFLSGRLRRIGVRSCPPAPSLTKVQIFSPPFGQRFYLI